MLEAIVRCDICAGSYTVEDAVQWIETCSRHEDAVEAHRFEQLLRSVLPAGLHEAHPRDLTGDLADWSCESGLYLFGPVGAGKSHAAVALVKRWAVHRTKLGLGARPVWLNMPTAILQTLGEFSKGDSGKPGKLWDAATEADLLVLDDLGVEQTKDWVRLRLYGLVEYRLHNALPMIVTSNLSLGDLGSYLGSPQIASRLSQVCAQVSFVGKSDRRVSLAPTVKHTTMEAP